MTEFLNYKVDLILTDGTKSTGTITHVGSQQISLGNAYQSSHPNSPIPCLKINSSQIADLKVIQLPPDLLKQSKNKQSKPNGGAQNAEAPANIAESVLLDDAIVFAKSSTPTTKDTQHNNDKNNYATPQASVGSSRSNTPRIRSAKVNNYQSFAESVDPDWGNESDVQDIKSSTDFDFAANLAMFDKKSVFADFQKKDSVHPGERLVGHNKVDNTNKVQKAKKEKYDNNEMVLNTNKTDNWDNIGDEKSSKPADSIKPLSKSVNIYKDTHVTPSQTFKLVNSNNLSSIPLSSSVQLLEIERLSSESYGVTPSIMSEVCASNLSQLITKNILGGSTRLSNKKNHNLPPLVILLIGSGRCGGRAFATGRHLTNHGVRVLAYVINSDESDSELLRQWNLFENSGGKVISSSVDELLNILNHQLDTPVELIMDALQGYDDHLEDIFYQEEDKKALQSLMAWCNEPQQQNKIMSLDIPSGIDGGSGTISDPSLKLNCKWCVSMGLPITGLIHAYKNGHLDNTEVFHYLIDVGIPNKVYSSKGNLRKFDKFWFGAESIIKLEVSNE